MERSIAIANGVVMLLLLGGGAAASAYAFVTPELRAAMVKPLPGGDYVNGKLTAAIEGVYKSELPIKNYSIDALNAFTFAAFREGRKGVVVGADGWLFSAEEYDWTPSSQANLDASLTHIGEIAAELRQRGVTLQIALVPEKADIYADLLTKDRPAAHVGKYERVRDRLLALTGSDVPDLREVLRTASANGQVFLATDTHWNVTGAGVVAKQLAAEFPETADIAEESFALRPDPVAKHSGDLLKFLQLGPFSGLLAKTAEDITPLVAVADESNVDDFLGSDDAAAGPQVVLVGTSYSANPLWSFEAQIKSALKRDVLNLAEEGHGPMEPMAEFLDKLRAGTISAKAVIWEVPIRYLDDAPTKKDAGSSA